MRPELAEARRRASVREAARGWERTGLIDRAARDAIDAAFPDDRVSRSVVWRVMTFAFVVVFCVAAAAVAFMAFRPTADTALGAFLLATGGALAGATEYLQGPRRFDGTGAEAATSFLAVPAATIGIAILGLRRSGELGPALVLLIFAALWLSAWRRWGFPLYALFGAVALVFGAGGLTVHVRLAWLAFSAASVALSEAIGERDAAQTAGWTLIEGAGLAAAYAAVNVFSLDHAILEHARPGASPPPPDFAGARLLAVAATALFPIAVLAAGLVRRRRVAIDLGLAFTALSLVTLRAYVRLGPLWLVLAEAGTAAAVLAVVAERWLDSGIDRERGGLTADGSFENPAGVRAVSAAAALATLSPDARPHPEAGGLVPGGGSFGGGGASADL